MGVRVTLALFVPVTELVPDRDVLAVGVAVVDDDAVFVAEDVGLPDVDTVAVLVAVIVAEDVGEPDGDFELVGEDVDDTEGTGVMVVVVLTVDVFVLVEDPLTEPDVDAVCDDFPDRVSVDVTDDVAVLTEENDGVDVLLLVFEVEEVAEEVGDAVVTDDVVTVDVPDRVGLLVIVTLGEPDAVLEGLAEVLTEVEPVDVLDGVPELLVDLLAEDDLDEEAVESPVGKAVLVRDTLGDPVLL